MGAFKGVDVAQIDDMQQEYVHRITKILLCSQMDELVMDPARMNIPINSSEPIFLAAEVFKDTLMSVGVNEDQAKMAKIAFY